MSLLTPVFLEQTGNMSLPVSEATTMAQGVAGLADGDDLIYFCGGRNATAVLQGCQVYLLTNCFAGRMPCRSPFVANEIPRWGAGAARFDGKLWIVGGFTTLAQTSVTNKISAVNRRGFDPEITVSVIISFFNLIFLLILD